jgi:hypothetical protein
VEFYADKEARVFAEISKIDMHRQACEICLSCESWSFSEIVSTWMILFEGDIPQTIGVASDSTPSKPIVIELKNGIRGNHTEPSVNERKCITTICPLDHCNTRIILEVKVRTRKGEFSSGKKPLALFN